MEIWQAVVLGILEGITEYLPVSSTGHLLVAQHVMGIGTSGPADKAAADAFAICIQGGAILAVTGLYWRHVLQMIRGLLGKDSEGFKLAINILLGFLPAAVIGLLFNDWIEKQLFGMWPVVFAWLVGGVLIILLSLRAHKRGEGEQSRGVDLVHMTWKMALIIGFMQCVAMWPGTSRSLMTIAGGLLVGLSVRSAIEYSFLLGVLTLTAATVKKALWKVPGIEGHYDVWFGGARLMWESYGTVPLIVGMIAATISAALAVKWLVGYLQRHGMRPFGYYRIAIGVVMAGLMLGGVLEL